METIHPLSSTIAAPQQFTYPFCYEPHALCRAAAAQVQQYIKVHARVRDDADKGKMFGVLVVERDGDRFFLAAYSGLLAGRNDWDWFVPPVFDAQQPDGVFKTREAEISAINRQIAAIENDERTLLLRQQLADRRVEEHRAVSEFKAMMAEKKRQRDIKRMQPDLDGATSDALLRESQFLKAELRRLQKAHGAAVAQAEAALNDMLRPAELLRERRREMSDSLQRWLFSQYHMLNARGEKKDLVEIFHDYKGTLPPAAAGDCCAPKLLQYAFAHHLRPLCMAEFWWGESPKAEIRHHLEYYPACRSRCLPILSWMMRGLDVEQNPQECTSTQPLKIVYEDQNIWVVDKPSGMLSVPGNIVRESVYTLLFGYCKEGEKPLTVHRLDMETSGLIVFAKNGEWQRWLQRQFEQRRVEKRYVAVVEGVVSEAQGEIDLPMRPNPMDRPRQVVDRENGRQAVTRYDVVGVENGNTRLALHPQTGRTHQLRVHCAHAEGLGHPIVGDRLYGHAASRMMLHCEELRFFSPDGEMLVFRADVPF